MRQWIAGLWLAGAAFAGVAAGCASSSGNPLFSLMDGGGDATQIANDAPSGDSSSCGSSGQSCCAGSACDQGLTCSGGTCEDLGDDGGDEGGSGGSSGGGSGGSSGGGSGGSSGGGSGGGSGSGSGSGSGGDAGHDKDSGGEDGGAVDCGSTPKVYRDDAGDIYCGYDAGSIYCGTGRDCCIGGNLGGDNYAPNQCGTFGKACPNGESYDAGGSPGLPVECAQIADCTANGVKAVACCLQGAKVDDTTCSYPKASDGTGIVCETGSGTGPSKCKTGETNVCSSQDDCPTGTTCTAGKWKILDFGFCL